jgi:hypothetical protein
MLAIAVAVPSVLWALVWTLGLDGGAITVERSRSRRTLR